MFMKCSSALKSKGNKQIRKPPPYIPNTDMIFIRKIMSHFFLILDFIYTLHLITFIFKKENTITINAFVQSCIMKIYIWS